MSHKSIDQKQQNTHSSVFEKSAPMSGNAFNLFAGTWSSLILGMNGPGNVQLFDDPRIKWLINELGTIDKLEVLELGPLEGGHTFMLEQSGANVFAIEANVEAFLRCLIVKNHFNLNAKFELGDFVKSLGLRKHYDLVVASGVLYHMSDPVDLLRKIAGVSDRLFLWTHFYEPDISKWATPLQQKIGTKWHPMEVQEFKIDDLSIRVVPQYYEEALGWAGFCGGTEIGSNWIYREDLLLALEALGFNDIQIAFETLDHQNGPSFCVLAQRQ